MAEKSKPNSKKQKLNNPYNQNHTKTPVKLTFPGWKRPTNEWLTWVEKISHNYAKNWEQSGICDGILSSMHEIKPNPVIIYALCEYWCPKTNSFIFPWGEATITLEDVIILAGLPVIGEPLNCTLGTDSVKALYLNLCNIRSKCRRATYSAWINYFNDEDNEQGFEYVGFLAYWLSRFVFSDGNEKMVGKHVFPFAVLLSEGVNLALAQGVLACLYQNLTYLKLNVYGCDDGVREFSVPGPFKIVHLWALERFPVLGSKIAKPLTPGQPRSGRWDKVCLNMSLVDIRLAIMSGGNFCWRPYASSLENWTFKSFYPEKEMMVTYSSDLDDDELNSFLVFLCSDRIYGIDCSDMYRPCRVAWQFGYDHGIPPDIALFKGLKSKKMSIVVPSRGWVPKLCDFNNQTLEIDLENSEHNYRSNNLSNEAAIITHVGDVVDDSQCIVVVNSDDEEVEIVGGLGSNESSISGVKTGVIDGAYNQLLAFDVNSKKSKNRWNEGTCLKNPIDVED